MAPVDANIVPISSAFSALCWWIYWNVIYWFRRKLMRMRCAFRVTAVESKLQIPEFPETTINTPVRNIARPQVTPAVRWVAEVLGSDGFSDGTDLETTEQPGGDRWRSVFWPPGRWWEQFSLIRQRTSWPWPDVIKSLEMNRVQPSQNSEASWCHRFIDDVIYDDQGRAPVIPQVDSRGRFQHTTSSLIWFLI